MPDSVFKKTRLKILDLGAGWTAYDQNGNLVPIKNKNQIEVIPKEIGMLHGLEQLDISYNNLKSLPQAMTTLSNFQVLALAYNKEFDIQNSIPV